MPLVKNAFTIFLYGMYKMFIYVNYIVPKQKSYEIENPFSMWGWINAWKLHPLCKGFDI